MDTMGCHGAVEERPNANSSGLRVAWGKGGGVPVGTVTDPDRASTRVGCVAGRSGLAAQRSPIGPGAAASPARPAPASLVASPREGARCRIELLPRAARLV